MQNSKTIAVIGAMECEISLLKEWLGNCETISHKSFSIFKAQHNGNTVILAQSGVGKVASASCTQYIIDKFNPDCIINTGVAGGVANGLKILDIVIGNSFIQHDFDVSALGYAKGYVCNGVNSDEPTVFEADGKLVNKIYDVAINVLPKENIHIGRIVSGDCFIADTNKKKTLKDMFSATAAEMESSAIAHCAELNDVPFVAIRAISDLADGTKIENYPEFELKAAKISANIIKNFLMTIN